MKIGLFCSYIKNYHGTISKGILMATNKKAQNKKRKCGFEPSSGNYGLQNPNLCLSGAFAREVRQ